MELTWETPPEAHTGARARYVHILNTLRERPNEWARLEVPGVKDPSGLATAINAGTIKGSGPAGDFEAVTRKVDGKIRLYVRHVRPLDAGTDLP